MIFDTLITWFLNIVLFIPEAILNLLPDGTMPDWYSNSTLVFQAVSAIGNLPIFDTLFEVLVWIIWFEIAMFGYRIFVMLLTWMHIIGGSGERVIK